MRGLLARVVRRLSRRAHCTVYLADASSVTVAVDGRRLRRCRRVLRVPAGSTISVTYATPHRLSEPATYLGGPEDDDGTD